MTGFLADTNLTPTLVNTIHLDVIEDSASKASTVTRCQS